MKEEGDNVNTDHMDSSTVLRVPDVSQDDFFEPVLLSDQDKNDNEMNQFPSQVELRDSSGRIEDAFESSLAVLESSQLDSPTFDDLLPHHSYASTFGSSLQDFGDNGYSPSESLQGVKPDQVLSNVSPELLHLVDSAIMGNVEILEKLKNIVSGVESFGEGNEAVSMAYAVVDSLLATMGGVESFENDDEDNPPSVMLNSRAAIVAGELIPWLPDFGDFQGLMSPRTRMMRGLLAILRACTRNRAMCSAAGLLGVLLRSVERIFMQNMGSMHMVKWDATPLFYCIQHLAGHSLSPRDMHQWLQVISKTLSTVWATLLLNTLEKAMSGEEVRGPATTFEFDGECSGLLGPGDSKWPFANGYAFATWIYIESFADNISTATTAAAIAMAAAATSGKSSHMSAAAAASALAGEGTAHMPRLFSFLTADNQGMEAYFHAQFLVVECGSGKGRKASLHFTYAFKPQCWYFVGLEHICKQGLLGKSESELRLYVDGSLYESRPFDFPRISKPLAFCCIGTNPPPTMAGLQRRRRQCPLFAEMGPVYIFKEPIGPEKMARLAFRGGDVLPSFGGAAGSPWLATNDHVQSMAHDSAILDTEIAGCIHLLYHPCLLAGRYCPDASPSGAAGMARRPAEVLGQVHIAARMRPAEALWAVAHGGPMCLLPLVVGSVRGHNLEPQFDDRYSATTALAAPVIRIVSLAIKHPGNNEEFHLRRGSEILSRILDHLLHNLSSFNTGKSNEVEELVGAIVSLCQSQNFNHTLKVQLFSTLLLDLKLWSLCSYGLQKKLFSSLADMVFVESSVMRDANAIQMLLDGCRRCYWTIRESDSVNRFSAREDALVGEVNSLVDELLVVVELLIVAAPPVLASDDVLCLLGFMVDCPQSNQVARVLHLLYRLVVQPNVVRAKTFSDAFISCGGIETLLVLLQRETTKSDCDESDLGEDDGAFCLAEEKAKIVERTSAGPGDSDENTLEEEVSSHEDSFLPEDLTYTLGNNKTKIFIAENRISHSVTAQNAWNNVYNLDRADGIILGIINLLGALIISGHLKCDAPATPYVSNNILAVLDGGTMFDDKVSLLLFGLQKAFQAAPKRLLSIRVYTALLAASLNMSPADDGLNFYDSGHRFQHFQILLVLLRSLPFASASLQTRALQDLLILACHPENRASLRRMDEWPEWILEILISNHETGGSKSANGPSLRDVEDFIHNFLIIMLQHSIREKDGWKDIEATIHCAEWLSMVGGSSTRDMRIRREESLPVFKRRLLSGLLDFTARELQAQTQVIAAAAAGVAAVGLPPKDAKVEAEKSAQVSVYLVENAIVILMLVEDHLRLQSKIYAASQMPSVAASPLCNVQPTSSSASTETSDSAAARYSSSGDSGGLTINVLTAMADANGRIPTVVAERLAASAATEPYESVSCAFVSYGSSVVDLAEGWKYRSRLWYGVGPPNGSVFGGGGNGWDSWKSALEKDSSGNWIELPLINKSVAMLQALLLDDSGLGGGLGIGGGSGTGMGAMSALYHLLDSDQPFLCMLRMVLISLREDADSGSHILLRNASSDGHSPDDFRRQSSSAVFDANSRMPSRKPRSALLWSVLSPILNMPVSGTKRQRVLVASCILYSEVWGAIGKDRNPLRKHYIEAILPPFVALLRRWRPLLAGIHELTTAEGINPLVVDERALAADTLPVEAALAMISPSWAASFASPPAAMALAMIAAGAAGGETSAPKNTSQLRRDSSLYERRTNKLHTFSSFQKPLEALTKTVSLPKDKAAAKAAALAAARDLERNAKIGSGRGLSAVAMATSAQRRSKSDAERVKRWNVSEAMGTAWMECLQTVDSLSVYGKDLNALCYKYMAVLVGSLALARNMQRSEVDRRSQVDVIAQHRLSTGMREWRKLIHSLVEMKCLFAPFSDVLCNPNHIFWRLDFKESSSRMRRILRRNYRGSDHNGAAANYDDSMEHKYDDPNVNASKASVIAAEAISAEAGNEQDEQDVFIDPSSNNEQPGEFIATKPENDAWPVVSAESKDGSVNINLCSGPNAAPVSPGTLPSEHDERVVLELSSSMVRPLKVLKGTIQITTKRINFIIDHMDRAAIETAACNGIIEVQEKDRSWLISSIHQIYSRRYLLRRSALELFMVDRSNYFFDFGSTEARRNAYRAIVQARPPYLNDIYLATQRPEQLLKRTQLMERWARWELSNFEYLMQLNTLAGRSYNDITQYPVFPWILSDYSSDNLDLSNPSSFRDLSKPIGALNDERLEKFQERYSSFDDPVIPKFLYGSHYSTAGTVLYYLSRVEPFTTLSIQLQGGKFDHADRMFSDIAGTWNGVLEDMSDVKELVPELFYMPEVLTNGNSIDFGTTQLGEKIDSVRLPPWAENPVDFIHKHRMALESEYVSEHLHEWIDLIFGHKQRGKEAVQANNVFFYITYEGTVDIDKISDPLQQRAAQDQIAYFGQTPSQLLTAPHIKRMHLSDVLNMQTIFRNPREFKPYIVPYPERCNLPASAIQASSDSIIIVDINAPAAHIAQHKWQPNTPDGQGTPFLFHHGKPGVGTGSGAFMRMFKGPATSGSEEWHFPQALAFPTSGIRSTGITSITCDNEIITGGHVDNSIRLISAEGAKTLEIARGHCAPVTCLAVSPDSSYLATGSRDSTVLLWRIRRFSLSRPSNSPEPSISPNSPTSVGSGPIGSILDKSKRTKIEGPLHVLRGHLGEVTCCAVSSDLGVVASCSFASDVLLHSVRRGKLIRRLVGVEAHAVSLSSDGIIVTWNKNLNNLSTFTLNGDLIARKQLPSSWISCIEVSVDGQSAVVGLNPSLENNTRFSRSESVTPTSEDSNNELNHGDELDPLLPSLCFFDLYTLKVLHTVKLHEGQNITAIALNKDNTNLLVSTENKQLIILSDPSLSLKVVDQMLKLGWEGDGLSPFMK